MWLAYQQGIIFQRFKEKEKFANMITEFDVIRSITSFEIAIVGVINKYPEIKMISLSFYFLKKYLKVIKEVCKENASEIE